jgi:ActR/RegA family two-component response regulator
VPIHLRLTHFSDVKLVVAALAEQLHDIKMLFMSGYSEYAAASKGAELFGDHCLAEAL